VALACADTAAPGGGGGGGGVPARIITLPVNHPALCADTATFWAKKGTDRLGRLAFDDGNCPQGEDYVELRVNAQSLFKRPDGSVIANGDSVLITFWVVDPDSMLYHFEPAGLLFDPNHPARLHIEYRQTHDDFDHDGQSTHADSLIKDSLAIWRMEDTDTAFTRLPSANFEDADEIEADVLGFSRFAIAY
jgi:hypothetical protein